MERLNLNTANRDQLLALPGVGPALADRIMAHRAKIGRFDDIGDLVHVDGISERLARTLADHLSVAEPGTEPPASLTVTAKVDDAGAGGDFTGYRITATGERRDEAVGIIPFALSGITAADGTTSLALPARDTLTSDVTFTVATPSGDVRGRTTLAPAQIADPVTITATAEKRPETSPNDDPAAGKPTRIRGRVIDSNGRRAAANLQVVLWAASKQNPQAADFRALVVVQTDGLGHFTGPYPLGTFTEAHATVAVGDGTQTVVVHLDDGAFPESIILVADLPDHDEVDGDDDDCACHSAADAPRDPNAADLARADGTYSTDAGVGRCVDFTKPNRTLEEFTYTYLVRTTEPDIRGLTLGEPPKIDIRDIVGKLNGTVLNEATTLRTRGLAIDTNALDLAAPSGTASPERAVDANDAGDAIAGEMLDVASLARAGVAIDARVLKTLARDPDGFTLTTLATAARHTAFADLNRHIGALIRPRPSRSRLTCSNPVDWDDDPTIYQACTIAHGHILRFKQEWVADGYSLGNLLYSLPLAPGQKKQIAVVDWERRETSARTELLTESERLDAVVDRDRDINEVVTGTITESTRGGSRSSNGGFGAGLGVGGIFGAIGAVLGIGGGTASADSRAWQDSSRNTSASALNQLRDRTVQSASAVRSQRSSVVQTVTQGERVTATTESVANYNHCHAITIQYFEVLRHLLVRQRMVDVQECLFVPLLMSRFDFDKALRWRHSLASAVPRSLRKGLDAIDRIAHNYAGSDLPVGRYADETLELVDGELTIRFQLTRPQDKDDDFDSNAWLGIAGFLGITASDFYATFLKNKQFKDRIFIEQLGPPIARRVIERLKVTAVKLDGSEVDLQIDPTLVTNFVNGQPLAVTLRMARPLSAVRRADIKAVKISLEMPTILGFPIGLPVLPFGSRVIVDAGSLRYRTAHLADSLFSDTAIRNDLTDTDGVFIATPLNRRELRNPREEDKEAMRALLDHLNENIERYHHHLWATMGDDRRYMLLDGFEAPNSGGRSVASVVDNELIGIVGNCLVLPVARGFHLDPTYDQAKENAIDLLEHYQPNTPIEPTRIALPTRGVYAEAVMGVCNSCEEKEETRFWRWEESPIPDGPAAILPVSTESRRADPPDLTAKDFPSPIIAMQSAPAAPDPTGVGAALALLGQSGVFGDITGLEGTQRNAAAALKGVLDTATTFGTKAADLALQGKMTKDIDKSLRTIQTSQARGLLSDDQARALTESAIRAQIGGGAEKPRQGLADQPEVRQLIDSAGGDDSGGNVRLERSANGTTESVDVTRNGGGASGGAGPIVNSTIGRRSTKADALAHVTTARSSTKSSPWKLDRTKTYDRLEAIVNDPNLIDQDGLNLCGPASFVRLWIARDPLAVARFATELYDTGKATIGNYEVAPSGDSLIAQDFAALQAAHNDFTIGEADWMILGSLRDAENFFFDFEGVPGEAVSAFTTPGEMAEWFEATKLYGVVSDEGNFFLAKGIDHAITLKPSPTRDIALLINAHMIDEMQIATGKPKSSEFILNAFPNHFVVLTSQIKETADDKVSLSVWSWGKLFTGTIPKATFEANYYGAVIAEGANP